MTRVSPPFWQKYAITNDFPNSCFARKLDGTAKEVGHCLDQDEFRVQLR